MTRRYRKKTSSSTEFEETAKDEDVPSKEMLQEIKERQKDRARPKGVNATILKKEDSTTLSASTTTSTEKTESDTLGLDQTFTTQSQATQLDILLEKYIEEEMGKRKVEPSFPDLSSHSSTDEKDEKAPPAKEDDLYEIPDHLKTEKSAHAAETQKFGDWLNGVQEIELPIEYKIKNIEETEKAKQDLLSKKKHYKRHKPGEKEDRASDDLVMERFKKRWRYH